MTIKTDRKRDVIGFFDREFGHVAEESVFDLVSASPDRDIEIRIVPKCAADGSVVLFTTGLSSELIECPVPEGPDKFAELYIQLPSGWDYADLSSVESYWPVLWLKGLAHDFAEPGAWLDDFTIYETAEGIAPHLRFDSFLIMADKEFKDSYGKKIELSRLVPLHPEERELEHRDGLPALLVALDDANVSLTVEPQRKSIVAR